VKPGKLTLDHQHGALDLLRIETSDGFVGQVANIRVSCGLARGEHHDLRHHGSAPDTENKMLSGSETHR
jgi:hypothetical protein